MIKIKIILTAGKHKERYCHFDISLSVIVQVARGLFDFSSPLNHENISDSAICFDHFISALSPPLGLIMFDLKASKSNLEP